MNEVNSEPTDSRSGGEPHRRARWHTIAEFVLLMLLIFAYAGDAAPMVNEAHYLVKAKSFWDPAWCANDLFVASTKAHTSFYGIFGWPTRFVSLSATAWIGRLVAWSLLALGLQRLCWTVFGRGWLSLIVALMWIAGVEYGNLAGEWVVGGIEAKVPAYGLILFAMADMSIRRWNRVWLWLGAASALHVLSGGWSVIAAIVSWTVTERKRENRVPLISGWLFAGGAIALFGLVPAVALTLGTSPEASTAAARIYSYYRIRHHLLPADFLPHWYLRHGILILATCIFGRRCVPIETRLQPLAGFTLGAVGIAGIGMIVGLLPAFAPDLAAKLLRFYWFRLTDAIVPLMFAMLIAALLIDNARNWSRIGLACCALALVLVSVSTFERIRRGVPPSVSNVLLGRDTGASRQTQLQVMRDWLAVCRWARLSSPQDAVFLTPRHQQTFKWYAHRAEVVNWKDVPQDAASLGEWNRRFLEIYPQRLGFVRVTIQYDKLREYRREYGARMMIVDRRVTGQNLPLVRLYPTNGEVNTTYAVYELPQD